MKARIMIIGPDLSEVTAMRHAILACHVSESIQVVYSPEAKSTYEFETRGMGLGIVPDISNLIKAMKIEFKDEKIDPIIFEKPVSKFINKSKRNYGKR